MVCEVGFHVAPVYARPKSFRRLASTRGFKRANEYGWIRVFEGIHPFATGESSKLVKVTLNTSVADINKELGIDEDLTLWVQFGGENSRRLESDEYPLRIQEQFMACCGWKSEARRVRLAVDPDLKHCLRWSTGPQAQYGGVLRSGTLHLLKGHVFPQWKPRPAYIIGSRLNLYSNSNSGQTEVLELSKGCIELCQPKAQRLVLRVRPQSQRTSSNGEINSHVFLGFNSVWERNLWFSWLKEKIH